MQSWRCAAIRRGAHAFVAPLDQAGDVMGAPDLVAGIAHVPGVVVETDGDVVLAGEFFNEVDGVRGFGGDGVKAHAFGEVEDLAGLGFVIGDAHHAVVHGFEAVVFEFGLEFGDHVVHPRRGVVHLQVAVFAAEPLAGIKFNDLAAGRGGFFDGLEGGEVVEGVGLAADGPAVDLVFVGDGGLAAGAEGRDGQQQAPTQALEGDALRCGHRTGFPNVDLIPRRPVWKVRGDAPIPTPAGARVKGICGRPGGRPEKRCFGRPDFGSIHRTN